jgi:hypothetical protein
MIELQGSLAPIWLSKINKLAYIMLTSDQAGNHAPALAQSRIRFFTQ